MHKFGLKLWSINRNYLDEAKRLHEQGIYDFIELYIVPTSYDEHIEMWKNSEIPYIIHAPHFRNGLNLASREKLEFNLVLASETRRFADDLNAEIIIYHPGIAGDIKETVYQLDKINDSRIVIENKPYFTVLNDGNICTGHSSEEIKYVLDNTNLGFCLDIGHCFCSANAKNINPIEYTKQFLSLNPKLFHLTDNDYDSAFDKHYHFGKGSYNIQEILALLPKNSPVTIETVKDSKDNLDDFKADIAFLRNCL